MSLVSERQAVLAEMRSSFDKQRRDLVTQMKASSEPLVTPNNLLHCLPRYWQNQHFEAHSSGDLTLVPLFDERMLSALQASVHVNRPDWLGIGRDQVHVGPSYN